MLEVSFRAESPAFLIPFNHVTVALERIRAVMDPARTQPKRRRSACRRRSTASIRKSSAARPSSATKASSPALRPRWWSRKRRALSSGRASCKASEKGVVSDERSLPCHAELPNEALLTIEPMVRKTRSVSRTWMDGLGSPLPVSRWMHPIHLSLPPESVPKSTSGILRSKWKFTPFFCMKRKAGRMNEWKSRFNRPRRYRTRAAARRFGFCRACSSAVSAGRRAPGWRSPRRPAGGL